tara:strand:- start:1229 stop:2503 length:1275 start_codon:yes stop_codon:yes gene_type:complete
MPRRKTQKRKQRKTKRNFKKRGGVGSPSNKRPPSPSLRIPGPARKKSRTSRQTTAVTAEEQEKEAQAVAEAEAEAVAMAAMRIEGPAMVENRLLPMVPSPHAPLMSQTPIDRTPLSDQLMQSDRRTQIPLTQSRYNAGLLMPTAGAEHYGPTIQRLNELIAKIESNQIRMQNLNIRTENWERYISENAPITYKAAEAFYVDQEDKIRDFIEKKQDQEQREHRENKRITENMISNTGKRTGVMTLALLATLMANDLYTDKPTGIPPYQRLIADTPADIVNKATGNDGLIQGVEEMDRNNPNYYVINTKSGEDIFFDPSTTTIEQWHEAKKKAILEQKPFDIYEDQDAVKFFLEQGNKKLLGIALKKISPMQQQLLERARLAQVIKEENKKRRHKIRGENTKNKRNNKRNNNNKHNTQRTRRGGKK